MIDLVVFSKSLSEVFGRIKLHKKQGKKIKRVLKNIYFFFYLGMLPQF